MRIPYAIISPDRGVTDPTHAYGVSAGADFYIPRFPEIIIDRYPTKPYNTADERRDDRFTTIDYLKRPDSEAIDIMPGENIRVKTGIAIEVDFGQVSIVCNRSGIASKAGLTVGAHIIDTEYSGEVIIDIHNPSNHRVILQFGDPIAQLIFVNNSIPRLFKLERSELYPWLQKTHETRGDNGYGSTFNGKAISIETSV